MLSSEVIARSKSKSIEMWPCGENEARVSLSKIIGTVSKTKESLENREENMCVRERLWRNGMLIDARNAFCEGSFMWIILMYIEKNQIGYRVVDLPV